MAEAVVEERQLLKTLRWYDGFVICLANPGFLLGSLGFSVIDLGGWGAAMVWGHHRRDRLPGHDHLLRARRDVPGQVGRVRALRQRGVAQVHDARSGRWRRSATGSAGRWCSRSSVSSPATSSRPPGSRASRTGRTRSAARSSTTATSATGSVHIGLQHLIAIGLILAVWAFNVFGTRIAVTFNYLAGVLLMVPLFCFTMLPFLNGDFHSSNLTYKLNDPGLAWGGWQLALVWIWIMIWSAGAVRPARPSRPSTRTRSATRERRSLVGGVLLLIVNTLVPIGLTGGVGAKIVEAYDYVGALNHLVGQGRDRLLRRRLCRELHHLDEHGDRGRQPRALRHLEGRHDDQAARAAEPVQRARERDDARHGHQHPLRALRRQPVRHPRREQHRLRAREHVRDRRAFVLLRKDRPNWPRPIRLPNIWVADRRRSLAALRVFSVVGIGWFQIAGGGAVYGGTKEKIIGFSRPRRLAAALPVPADRPGQGDGRTGVRRRRRCPTRHRHPRSSHRECPRPKSAP